MTSSKAPLIYLLMLLVALSGVGCVPPGGGEQNSESDPDFRAAMNRKQSGNYVRALESFERALQRNPRSAATHFELGLIYYQNITNYVAAIYHFDQVERLQPTFSRIDVVRQLIKVCKQEMVRDAMGGFTVQMQREMERLERLTQENAALRQENAQLQAQIQRSTELTPVGGVAPKTPEPLPQARADLISRPETTQRSATMVPGTNYTFKRGDTLYSIAQRNGLSPEAILAANPGLVPTRIGINQVIRIPAHESTRRN